MIEKVEIIVTTRDTQTESIHFGLPESWTDKMCEDLEPHVGLDGASWGEDGTPVEDDGGLVSRRDRYPRVGDSVPVNFGGLHKVATPSAKIVLTEFIRINKFNGEITFYFYGEWKNL